jgi:SAM-dependent methyltransferase
MPYTDIVKHYEECYKIHGDNCKGVDWPNEKDTLKRYKVMLELIKFDTFHNKCSPSVLDFGCGLGHMYDYITNNNLDIEYAGLDMSEVFVCKCKEKYPSNKFYRADLIAGEGNDVPRYDYIIMNGVLTEKNGLTYGEMFLYFTQLIKKVYEKCNYGIAFNVMSKDVDWERDDLFHLPLNELSRFLTKELTRDFIIRYDYGLYEYTVYIYKKGRANE